MSDGEPKKVLVLGATGMLGHTLIRLFANSPGYAVTGTVRSAALPQRLLSTPNTNFVSGVLVENHDSLIKAFSQTRPAIVINCIGLIKQLAEAADPLEAIPINAVLPHRLARLCAIAQARLVHISTDCVFDGARGNYAEEDYATANDLYGRSKLLGEVDYEHAITLRTSIIGHELNSKHSLLEWFLSQRGSVRGFVEAIFSGLPTVELARVIRDFVLPTPQIRGLYHVSAAPINKYDLLTLVAKTYGKTVTILPSDEVKVDRSLDSTRFRSATGYKPPQWDELIRSMHEFR